MNKLRIRKALTTTLVLTSALVSFGCKQPLHDADITKSADMTKPITTQSEPDMKYEQRTIDKILIKLQREPSRLR